MWQGRNLLKVDMNMIIFQSRLRGVLSVQVRVHMPCCPRGNRPLLNNKVGFSVSFCFTLILTNFQTTLKDSILSWRSHSENNHAKNKPFKQNQMGLTL